jgi:hypothetical protein
MITNTIKYIQWMSPEDMHVATIEWKSELQFIEDEHYFFEELMLLFTLQLLKNEDFSVSRDLAELLSNLKKENSELKKEVIKHKNKLEILVDGVDEFEKEKEYKIHHKELAFQLKEHFKNHKNYKKQLFKTVKPFLDKKSLNP